MSEGHPETPCKGALPLCNPHSYHSHRSGQCSGQDNWIGKEDGTLRAIPYFSSTRAHTLIKDGGGYSLGP